jgi:hypothetical protein
MKVKLDDERICAETAQCSIIGFDGRDYLWGTGHAKMPISIDDAIALIVKKLRTAPQLSPTYVPNARNQSYWADLLVTSVLRDWWFSESEHVGKNPMPDPGETDYAPFHDAAWELARRGVLRPGPAFPGLSVGLRTSVEADGFALTTTGRDWITKYDQQGPFPLDPGRFSILVDPYADRFGSAFIQRVTEAAGCYRSLNYLAACAMAGAACETILLTIAIQRTKDEEKAVKIYRSRDGRRTLINLITTNLKPHMKQAIETATSLLSYWRDAAAHGHATEISEFAAHDALSRLLRFAQFVNENWSDLTS